MAPAGLAFNRSGCGQCNTMSDRLALMSLPQPLSAAGGQALAIINSPSERRSSRRTSTERVDGAAGLATWLKELAEQMEGRA